MKTLIAQAIRNVSTYIWVELVEPHYDDSPMPEWLFGTLWNISGALEEIADRMLAS